LFGLAGRGPIGVWSQWKGVMAEVTFTFIVLGMLALQAAVFIGLVIVGVRLANGAPVMPARKEWSRRITLYFQRLSSAVARARHYDGTRA
jgi:hypothetical protein